MRNNSKESKSRYRVTGAIVLSIFVATSWLVAGVVYTLSGDLEVAGAAAVTYMTCVIFLAACAEGVTK